MDASTITSLIDSLAWPITVLIIVLVLRRPLSELIPLLRKLKYKDFEAEFGRQAEQIAEIAAQLPTPQQPVAPTKDPILKLVQLDPRAAILASWGEVERAATAAATSHGFSMPYASPMKLAENLERANVVDSTQSSVIRELAVLRNAVAAHPPDVTLSPSTAHHYWSAASKIVSILSSQPSLSAHRPPGASNP